MLTASPAQITGRPVRPTDPQDRLVEALSPSPGSAGSRSPTAPRPG